jgi:uncharacterized protein (DUF1330 family)
LSHLPSSLSSVRAYVIVDITIHDPVVYEKYKELAPAGIATYGGKYLVRGAKTTILEGTWSPKRLVILQFPSAEKARAWWNSDEYAEAKALRHTCATTQMLLVEGPEFDPARR